MTCARKRLTRCPVRLQQQMFTLAHISDIHLAPLPPVTTRNLMSKRFTGYVNWQRNRNKKIDTTILSRLVDHMKAASPDHIAVTGDLVNLALDAEFQHTRQWLDKLGTPENVSVILGNHDCYVPGAQETACVAWHPFMMSDGAVGDVRFPYQRKRGQVALIGTNSGHVSPTFYATGVFDGAQAGRTADMLKAAKERSLFRVVMIHHPPFRKATTPPKRLIGASRFRAMIAETGAELILHGHTHIDSLQWIDGPDGKVPVVGVPSASHAPPSPEATKARPGARYNLFSISGTPGQWQCHMLEFGYDRGATEITLLGERELYADVSATG